MQSQYFLQDDYFSVKTVSEKFQYSTVYKTYKNNTFDR